MKESRKKVLIISYHYPPDISVGALRPSKMAEYFPEHGWDPLVLTSPMKAYRGIGGNGAKNLRSEHICSIHGIPNFREIYLGLKNCYLKWSGKGDIIQKMHEWTPPRELERETLPKRLKRYFNSSFVWLPDDKNGWILPAAIRGLRLIKKEKIDALFTTSPPHSVHLVGLILKILTQKKWIADFRDPWDVYAKPRFIRSKPGDAAERWLNRKVVEKSDWVVSVTEEMTERLKTLYPEIPKEKFYTIWNGFDHKEVKSRASARKYDKFTVTYTGTFYLERNPALFLTAVRDLIEENRIGKNGICIRFIGDCHYAEGRSIHEMVAGLGLKEVVQIMDPKPHDHALEETAKSHAVLLLAPNQPLQIPAKTFEYIGLRCNIIAECGEGATKNLLSQYPRAVCVPSLKLNEMKNAIMTFWNQPGRTTPVGTGGFPFGKYERRNLAGKMADLLNRSMGQ